MLDKKDPGKFTVRFNAADPQHKTVIDLLNQQGRYKAQFLVNAILHYVHCPETPDVYTRPAVGHNAIEDIVQSVLAQQEKSSREPIGDMREPTGIPLKDSTTTPKADSSLETEDRDAILRTLNAFRPT